jgi:hypothetical protein
LYIQVIIWVNTILIHIDTRAICLVMKILAWYIDPTGIKNKNILKYSYPIGINNDVILTKDPQMGTKERRNQCDTSRNRNFSKLHLTSNLVWSRKEDKCNVATNLKYGVAPFLVGLSVYVTSKRALQELEGP